MKKYLVLIITTIVAALTYSCREYVEIEPVGSARLLKYTSDYRGLMNNTDLLQYTYSVTLAAGDDVDFADTTYQNSVSNIVANVYTWNDYIYQIGNQDTDWSNLYRGINYCNVVVDGIMSSSGGTQDEKEQTLAEALVHRAYFYWVLVNMYGKQYDVATASSDLGVPLLLSADLYEDLSRASVEKVYEQILDDLQGALPYLSKLPDFNVLPSQAAVYAMQARTYLSMGLYDLSLESARQALDIQNGILNLNDYAGNPYGLPIEIEDPEIIFSKQMRIFDFYNLPISEELLELQGVNDLRYQLFTQDGSLSFPAFNGRAYIRQMFTNSGSINVGLSVPEVMLIQAECLARAGDISGAMTLINELRANRISTDSYEVLEASSSDAALEAVLNERRRELFGRGMRWFDQKRLNLEERFERTVVRDFRGETFTLSPNSPKYVFPIFETYIDLNPELEPNPR